MLIADEERLQPFARGLIMAWLFLFVAGMLEIVWAVGLKRAEGFTRLGPAIITVSAMVLSLALLGVAMRTLPLGTAYAVWTGIGTIGTVIVGILFFGEAASPVRLLCAFLIVAGVAGLKLVTPR
jgi:quaternary ammonium compound-resistance protein SugE